MRSLLYGLIAALLIIIATVSYAHALSVFTVPQGGTGIPALKAGSIPFGNGTSPFATSSALQFSNALSRLTVTYASSTALSADTICLTADICRTSWPSGSSSTFGTSSLSALWPLIYTQSSSLAQFSFNGLATTSPWSGSGLAWRVTDSAISTVATGTLSSTDVIALSSTARSLVGGAAQISTTPGTFGGSGVYTFPTDLIITANATTASLYAASSTVLKEFVTNATTSSLFSASSTLDKFFGTQATTTSFAVSSTTVSGTANIKTLNLPSIISAAVITSSAGVTSAYSGTNPCGTNQAISSLSALIVGSCSSTFATAATTLTINGTTNQITSSVGAQDLSANRTVTLSFPTLIINPNASTTFFSNLTKAYFGATATTTIDSTGNIVIPSGSNLTVTGKSDGCATFATGVLNSTGVACGSSASTDFTWSTVNGTAGTAGTSSPMALLGVSYFGANAANTGTSTFTSSGYLGVGTTSPWANLSVQATASTSNQTLFAIASTSNFSGTFSTTTLFTVSNTGSVSAAGGTFVISSTGAISKINNASVNFAGAALQGANAGGDFLFQNNVNTANSGVKLQVSGSSCDAMPGCHISFFVGSFEKARFDGNGYFGIGTTSPTALIDINTQGGASGATTTLFRIASSTPGATTTLFQINNVGVASTTNLIVSGVSQTQTGTTCLQITSSGTVSSTGAACGTAAISIAPTSIVVSNGSGNGYVATSSDPLWVTALNATSTTRNSSFGSTSPWAALSVQQANTQTGPAFAIGSSTWTSFLIGNQGLGGVKAGVSTSSPWAAFSINATTSQVSFAVGSSTGTYFVIDSRGYIGDSTSTPWGQFSLNPVVAAAGVPEFVIGSTTRTDLIIAPSGFLGLGTTTPFARLSVGGGNGSSTNGTIFSAEHQPATSTSMTIDWKNGNQQLIKASTSATTIAFSNYTDGMTLRLIYCNPQTTAGAITWPNGATLMWSGGTTPTQTTTANKCDIYSFVATQGTTTLKILGAQTANF